jgi:hypothetical protein
MHKPRAREPGATRVAKASKPTYLSPSHLGSYLASRKTKMETIDLTSPPTGSIRRAHVSTSARFARSPLRAIASTANFPVVGNESSDVRRRLEPLAASDVYKKEQSQSSVSLILEGERGYWSRVPLLPVHDLD